MQLNLRSTISSLLMCMFIFLPFSARAVDPVVNATNLANSKNKGLPLLGKWSVDPLRSLIKLNNINYRKISKQREPKIAFSIERVIADYLHYIDSNDQLNYSAKIVDFFLYYEIGEEAKEKSDNFSWFNLHLPIDNVFNELLFIDLEALIVKNKRKIPIMLKRLMIKEFVVFPKKDSHNKYGDFDLEGVLFDGNLKANGKANPFTSPLPMNLNLSLKNLSLDRLNPWLKESASLKMKKGKVDIFVEFATKKGKLEGYLKFFTEDAEIMNEWNDKTTFFNNLKKSVMNFGLNLMERSEEDIISGKIKFHGEVDSVDLDYSSLFQTLIDHFFDGPLKRKYDKSINLKNL